MFQGEYATNYGATIASSVLIIVPELIFYAFFQRYIVDGITAGAIKG
jgi:raffinose/stachyose/melibiose transport system permease protein